MVLEVVALVDREERRARSLVEAEGGEVVEVLERLEARHRDVVDAQARALREAAPPGLAIVHHRPLREGVARHHDVVALAAAPVAQAAVVGGQLDALRWKTRSGVGIGATGRRLVAPLRLPEQARLAGHDRAAQPRAERRIRDRLRDGRAQVARPDLFVAPGGDDRRPCSDGEDHEEQQRRGLAERSPRCQQPCDQQQQRGSDQQAAEDADGVAPEEHRLLLCHETGHVVGGEPGGERDECEQRSQRPPGGEPASRAAHERPWEAARAAPGSGLRAPPRISSKQAPPSAELRTMRSPPSSRAIMRAIGRPRPAPPWLRAGSSCTKRSKIRSRSGSGTPGPGVGDRDARLLALAAQLHLDAAAAGRVAHGVVEQVRDGVLEQVPVGVQPSGVVALQHRQHHLPLLAARAVELGEVSDDVGDRERLRAHGAAGLPRRARGAACRRSSPASPRRRRGSPRGSGWLLPARRASRATSLRLRIRFTGVRSSWATSALKAPIRVNEASRRASTRFSAAAWRSTSSPVPRDGMRSPRWRSSIRSRAWVALRSGARERRVAYAGDAEHADETDAEAQRELSELLAALLHELAEEQRRPGGCRRPAGAAPPSSGRGERRARGAPTRCRRRRTRPRFGHLPYKGRLCPAASTMRSAVRSGERAKRSSPPGLASSRRVLGELVLEGVLEHLRRLVGGDDEEHAEQHQQQRRDRSAEREREADVAPRRARGAAQPPSA